MSFFRSLGVSKLSRGSDVVAPVPNDRLDSISRDAEKNDVDVEIQKGAAQPYVEESGVARVEALQAVWGKKGRYILIAGLVPIGFAAASGQH